MAITVYRSTDASAPVLSGTAGALAGVLDACLVTGYGSKAAAGWATEFTGTNLRAYRAATGNRLRLRIDDTGTTIARAVGYEAMTDVNTGTAAFPVEAQQSGGTYWIKSDAASAAARPWILIATGRYFIFFANTNAAASPASSVCAFGDVQALRSNDSWATILIGAAGSTITAANARGFAAWSQMTSTAITIGGHYFARASSGIAGSVAAGKHCSYLIFTNNLLSYPYAMGGGTDMGSGATLFHYTPTGPLGVVNSVIIEPTYLTDVQQGIRAILPGMWNIGHYNASTMFNHGDTVVGTGPYIGKTFEVWKWVSGTASGAVLIEVSDTWQI